MHMQRLKKMAKLKEASGILDSSDAAKLLGIEVSTFRTTYIKLLKEKAIKFKGVWLFQKQDIIDLMEQINSQDLTKIQQDFNMLGQATG